MSALAVVYSCFDKGFPKKKKKRKNVRDFVVRIINNQT